MHPTHFYFTFIWQQTYSKRPLIYHERKPADRTAHTTAFFKSVLEHWLEREISYGSTMRSHLMTHCNTELHFSPNRRKEMFYITLNTFLFLVIWPEVTKETHCELFIGYFPNNSNGSFIHKLP